MLIILSGLPATGKSTLARHLATGLHGVWLRIDTIEQAIRDAGLTDPGPAGYMAAYALAETNLRLGHTVIADSVNPLTITRTAWHQVAQRAQAPHLDIEIICSDTAEHRRRCETRSTEIAGLTLPSWAQIQARHVEAWASPRFVLDTAGRTESDCYAELLAAVAEKIK